MDDQDEARIESAVAWQQALERDDAGWDGFTRWLEADPRHRAAFDEIALIDSAVDRHRETLRDLLVREQEPSADTRPTRRWVMGGGIAAALALSAGLALMQTPSAEATLYTSRPGESTTLGLKDGTQIALSADSAVRVGARQQDIAVERGGAFFDVPHDPRRTLTVSVNGYRITDIGTRFSVDDGAGRVTVAVAEGTVTVTPPGGNRIPLDAGQRLTAANGGAPRVTPVSPQSVASWREGRLVYDDAPLAVVAADISRYRGTQVSVDPALKDRRFSGVLTIGDGTQLVSDLAAAAGLRVVQHGGRVMLRAGLS
ncbi:MAG: FecR family protein [Sphingomonas sp.]